jgi:hypothetical protein
LKVLKRLTGFLIFLMSISLGLAALVIVYQASLTIEVIDTSLARHAAQYLIEASTAQLVSRELAILHSWLAVTAVLLLLATVAAGGLLRYILKLEARNELIINEAL